MDRSVFFYWANYMFSLSIGFIVGGACYAFNAHPLVCVLLAAGFSVRTAIDLRDWRGYEGNIGDDNRRRQDLGR